MTDAAAVADALDLLECHPKARQIAERALRIEDDHAGDVPNEYGYTPWIGWEYGDIPAHAKVLRHLVGEGLIREVSKSNKYTYYRLADPASIRAALAATVPSPAPVEDDGPDVPDDFLDVVVGLTEAKWRIGLAVASPKPVHVLLRGPWGSAKTIILDEFARLRAAQVVVGGSTTRAGLFGLLKLFRPRWLLVDEIEKGTITDLALLLRLMEDGRVDRVVHGQIDHLQLLTTVVATCNSTDGMRGELLDRFEVIDLEDYTESEFRDVVFGMLTRREGIDPELAQEIANLAAPRTRSVRKARNAARLCAGNRLVARQLIERWS